MLQILLASSRKVDKYILSTQSVELRSWLGSTQAILCYTQKFICRLWPFYHVSFSLANRVHYQNLFQLRALNWINFFWKPNLFPSSTRSDDLEFDSKILWLWDLLIVAFLFLFQHHKVARLLWWFVKEIISSIFKMTRAVRALFQNCKVWWMFLTFLLCFFSGKLTIYLKIEMRILVFRLHINGSWFLQFSIRNLFSLYCVS